MSSNLVGCTIPSISRQRAALAPPMGRADRPARGRTCQSVGFEMALLRRTILSSCVKRDDRLSLGEEEGLSDRRLYRIRHEGLGDQIGRFGTLPGQQTLREGRDEDHRAFMLFANLMHSLNA